MGTRPIQKVFVSFSGRTRKEWTFARTLLVRLKQQDCDPWMYARRETAIPPGYEIVLYCEEKIRECDLFIAIVSESSLESPICKTEVRTAIETSKKRPLPIIPLVTCSIPLSQWPVPYNAISGFKHITIDPSSNCALEDFIHEICVQLDIRYNAPEEEVPSRRFPLLTKLDREIQDRCARNKADDMGVYRELREEAASSMQFYALGDIEKAVESLNRIIYLSEKHFGKECVHYPYIAKAALLGEIGLQDPKAHTDELRKSEEIFLQLLERGADSVDANVYAGLGFHQLLKGNAAEAVRYYQEANKICLGTDPDILCNLLLAQSVSNDPFIGTYVDTLLDQLASGTLVRQQEDFSRIQILVAMGQLSAGRPQKCKELLASIEVREIPPDLLLELANRFRLLSDRLQDRQFIEDAVWLLESALNTQRHKENKLILHRLARYLFEAGLFQRARRRFDKLVAQAAAYPQYLVECALCCIAMNDHKVATSLCKQATQIRRIDKAFPQPDPDFFYYYLGFAHWLLREDSLANDDFKLSERPAKEHYRYVLPSLDLER